MRHNRVQCILDVFFKRINWSFIEIGTSDVVLTSVSACGV